MVAATRLQFLRKFLNKEEEARSTQRPKTTRVKTRAQRRTQTERIPRTRRAKFGLPIFTEKEQFKQIVQEAKNKVNTQRKSLLKFKKDLEVRLKQADRGRDAVTGVGASKLTRKRASLKSETLREQLKVVRQALSSIPAGSLSSYTSITSVKESINNFGRKYYNVELRNYKAGKKARKAKQALNQFKESLRDQQIDALKRLDTTRLGAVLGSLPEKELREVRKRL